MTALPAQSRISPRSSSCATSLLIACRDVLLGVGTSEAAALVAHIDALLDLDDEASPGSQR